MRKLLIKEHIGIVIQFEEPPFQDCKVSNKMKSQVFKIVEVGGFGDGG